MQKCSFISHQPKDFPWKYGNNPKAHSEYIKELRRAIAVAVNFDEIDTFYCGLEHSADLDFAEAVLYQKKKKYYNIKLVCVVHNQNQCEGWNRQDIDRYNAILEKADDKKIVPDISLNTYLIDNAVRLIFVWNEKQSGAIWESIVYAIEQNRLTYFIRLNDIKADTDEPNGRLKRQLKEAEQASTQSLFTQIAYTLLIQELIKEHPNPKSVFKLFITNNPAFKREILRLTELYELDLSEDFN